MKTVNPFCIIAQARSGSTLLRHAFNEHPQIICHGEVLSRKCINGLLCEKSRLKMCFQKYGPLVGIRHWINGWFENEQMFELRANIGVGRLLIERDADTVGFLNSHVFDIDNECTGFKIVYEDLFKGPSQQAIVRYLKEHQISICHVTRLNPLRAYVSRIRMGRFGVTHSDSQTVSKSDSVIIDPQKVLNYQLKQQAYAKSVEEMLKDLIITDVHYETIEDGYHESIEKLGLRQFDMVQKLTPVGIPNLQDYIRNYEEVAEFDTNCPCIAGPAPVHTI